MKKRISSMAGLCGLLLASTITPLWADQEILLGPRKRVENLFSYPNNCNNVCFIDETLETTVTKYLTQSLQRDNFINTQVTVSATQECSNADHDVLVAHYSGDPLPEGYAPVMQSFFLDGDKAYEASNRLLADKKWAYNWRFFLPVGLAMYNQKSVQLLHFPPDYSLEQVQDYLNSKTSKRWEDLLVQNGVKAEDVALYEAIIDIAPIAAPSDAGSALSGTYGYYKDYVNAMLPLRLLKGKTPTAPRPMVAYGAPVRDWLKSYYQLSLKVLDTGTITLSDSGAKVPVLGANHPSYIWYAVQNAKDPYKTGVSVMKQDLASACWQAKMGNDPKIDPTATINGCVATWNQPDKQYQVCMLVETQALGKSEEESKKFCQNPPPSRVAPATTAAAPEIHESDDKAPWDQFGHFEHLAPRVK
ncbi:MAG: hypothetical protein HQM03_20710 [Magnetococcales bacterium]|nr:hypothetical protein [Magnetococcales bacterium]